LKAAEEQSTSTDNRPRRSVDANHLRMTL